jgi:hypothetical protein
VQSFKKKFTQMEMEPTQIVVRKVQNQSHIKLGTKKKEEEEWRMKKNEEEEWWGSSKLMTPEKATSQTKP